MLCSHTIEISFPAPTTVTLSISVPCPTTDTLRLAALHRKATELVGIDDKSLEVVKMLTEGDEVSKKQFKVVSIVGSGGLGKTTLANAVYEKLKREFDCVAFVTVSLNPNMKMIYMSLLRQFDKHTYQNINEASWSEEELRREIETLLGHKRSGGEFWDRLGDGRSCSKRKWCSLGTR